MAVEKAGMSSLEVRWLSLSVQASALKSLATHADPTSFAQIPNDCD